MAFFGNYEPLEDTDSAADRLTRTLAEQGFADYPFTLLRYRLEYPVGLKIDPTVGC
jgi:hypothetical protein